MRPEERPPLGFRFLRPADVDSLCALLNGSFEGEYREQGLDVSAFRTQYRLVALANRILVPLRREFFQVVVAREPSGRVVGTMTSFPVDAERWYQGFGAIHPDRRGEGLYKRVIRRSLEGLERRGARWGGGEIRIDNMGALYPYRDVFGCDVMPIRKLYMVPPEAYLPAPTTRRSGRRVSGAEARRLPGWESIHQCFQGGFLVEEDLQRSVLGCALRWRLPPITVESRVFAEAGRVLGFVRVRTHWPARIHCLDALHFPPEVGTGTVRDILLSVLPAWRTRTSMPLRIYADPTDPRQAEVCDDLGLPLLSDVYPIRTDVNRALERSADLDL